MAVAMTLEMCIVGPGTGEVSFTWVGVDESLEPKKLSFEFCDVFYAEVKGKQSPLGVNLRTRVGLAITNPMTQHLAEELASNSADGMTEEAGNADDAE